jgi:hypothetical protein
MVKTDEDYASTRWMLESFELSEACSCSNPDLPWLSFQWNSGFVSAYSGGNEVAMSPKCCLDDAATLARSGSFEGFEEF